MQATSDKLGVPVLEDYNGREQEGVGVFQQSISRSRRYSTSVGYLHDGGLPNLAVLTRAQVTRVRLEGSRATGVDVLDQGRARRRSPRAARSSSPPGSTGRPSC